MCEDDDRVRELLRRVLVRAGYEVLSASTPDQALALLAGGARPAALVTDVVMPGTTGTQLAERAAEHLPGLPALFMSGYTAEVIRDRGQLPPGSAFVEKPFTSETLLEAVAKLPLRAGAVALLQRHATERRTS